MHSIKSEHKHKAKFESIGTIWEIETAGHTPAVFDEVLTDIHRFLESFDKTYSRFRDDSYILSLGSPGTYTVPEEMVELLLYYVPLYKLTKGAFTPLIGMMLEQAGYDKRYSFQTQELHDIPDFLEAVVIENNTTITIKKKVTIDIGALGKGYAIDQIEHMIRKKSFQEYVVNAGGDIFCYGAKPLTIGLEHPFQENTIIGTAQVHNKAICSSAGNKRAWGEFHHIMNPITKKPVEDIVATWVIAETAVMADALATCLFFVDHQQLKKHYQFDFMVLTRNKLSRSVNFPGELFV